MCAKITIFSLIILNNVLPIMGKMSVLDFRTPITWPDVHIMVASHSRKTFHDIWFLRSSFQSICTDLGLLKMSKIAQVASL